MGADSMRGVFDASTLGPYRSLRRLPGGENRYLNHSTSSGNDKTRLLGGLCGRWQASVSTLPRAAEVEIDPLDLPPTTPAAGLVAWYAADAVVIHPARAPVKS